MVEVTLLDIQKKGLFNTVAFLCPMAKITLSDAEAVILKLKDGDKQDSLIQWLANDEASPNKLPKDHSHDE